MDNARQFLGKKVLAKIDKPIGTKHPKHGFVYMVNYGFIPNTQAPDGEEVDAYVLGVFEPLAEFTGRCIAIIHRLNDNDDKVIIVPEGVDYNDKQIMALTEFQERFFKSKVIKR
ncbi:MAG: inorganic pyrophosphatase [Candidatus Buchananbacteria bacterium RIFCSPHIGHO2_02_FULL_40_13]|uniref:inorganic diphosphatase n=1 Tax=Candidatus Buchananbacteria bacterium RIFCSPLOWO2_01_FULL_39_33 TaxID=1797543 RepID=A0A1G1YNB1_9BACT|nr:MAG: inorganic pyrophosphatase [Candidatus Buchananbacteria bacterium RIFCSPHIGHO2_01_FULL_40_35]OGY51168.1 MAG: inorganic pyrophosphatase [Candidatus Buchananbacteria bacterium RIFCSPHIGHO2_02_FULL_40_13]OGY53286.1 MAG: inorganic pyrophosphatase [Candidatus Buchananbacteria bacterium RIFCSPLOWO2_01_FULL_39_33]